MYCGVYVIKGYLDVSVLCLDNIFFWRKLNIYDILELDYNLKNFLKVLGKVVEERSFKSIVEEIFGVV